MNPVEQALIRERYQVGTNETLLFTILLIGVIVAIVAPESSNLGVLSWALLMALSVPLPKIVHGLEISFDKWFRYNFVIELINGIAWGSTTWLALPKSEVRQALLCVLLTGVIVASASISAAQFTSINFAYIVPFAALSMSGYVFAENGLTVAAVFLAVAFAYCIVMSSEHREVHRSLVKLLMTNDELLQELETEHEALSAANQLLDKQAWTDSLTGLANRPAMANELAKRLGEIADDDLDAVSVAYLDLDGFKQINDTWGHHTGDLLLIAIAERLRHSIETGDVSGDPLASRLGGDEFVIVSSAEPEVLATELAHAFHQPLLVGDRRLAVQMSLGVAATSAATDPDQLLRNADKALYQHKGTSDSSAGWQIFDDLMRQELEVRRDLEQRMSRAFAEGDIDAWYQPIVDLHTGEIKGAEALARWSDNGEVRTAGTFMDVLTQAGLLDQLTERTFASAHRVQKHVTAKGLKRPRISINVAPQQLEQVLTTRSNSDDFASLAIEITEHSAIPNPEHVTKLLVEARRLGAAILVDDFGIGHSSLGRIASLPIDGLKIDQSFIATLSTSEESRAVVSTIVDLASKLDLSVIAEGVETHADVEQLIGLGVRMGQGFHFAKAVPAEQFIEWLVTGHDFGEDHHELPQAA